MHNHHDTLKAFPSGGVSWTYAPEYDGPGRPRVKERQRAGWMFSILPYLEGDTVWRGGNASNIAACQRVAISTPNPNFFCPSRSGIRVLPSYPRWYGPSGSYEHAQTDYAGSDLENNGAIRYNRCTRMADLMHDGTSNTFLAGEARKNLRYLGQYQSDDNEGYSAGWDHDTMRYTSRVPLPDFNGSGDGNQQLGSSHTAGVNMLFGDGSVRMISWSVNGTNFYRMGRTDDGGVVMDQ